ncbi:hypothetical protein AAVH_02225 [Aphelenchoides avenae]|nr:hypothetical protein AAVH_02225 [Aphelenchus avenae]
MHLPVETLKSIAAHLSRADLGSLQQVNIVSRDLVARDFATFPRVHVSRLRVLCIAEFDHRYFLESTEGNVLAKCTNDEDFFHHAKFCIIDELTFDSLSADRKTFEVLAAVKTAWAEGVVRAPGLFTSQALLRTAFNEVFPCKQLYVSTVDHPEYRHAFVPLTQFIKLTAVRECLKLHLRYRGQFPQPKDVSDWLQRATTWPSGPKELELRADWVDCAPLVTHLREAFDASDQQCPYRLVLQSHWDSVDDDCRINELTNECLTITNVPQTGNLLVERKPLE